MTMEGLERLSLRERLGLLKARMQERMDEVSDDVSMKASIRARESPEMLLRWRTYCGVETDGEIDYGNPCVYIEYCACDPKVYAYADDPEDFCELTGSDPETYRTYYWPDESNPDA